MSITINNTLPLNWDSTNTYSIGDTVSYGGIIYVSLQNNNREKNPKNEVEYWKPLDIFVKDLTVMPHGKYSGDENLWERDQLYIDSNGYVYINNEITGINVKGRDASTVTFENLTPAQKEQLRGDKGDKGDKGDTGPRGEQGPPGEVILTEEQIEALRGPQGKSVYQIWIDAGNTGTEEDFLDWVRNSLNAYDTFLSEESSNAVQNKTIYAAFLAYKIVINATMEEYLKRLTKLENRLKAEYNDNEENFTFGITNEGKYGYIKEGTDRVIPFDNSEEDVLQTTFSMPSNVIATSQFANNQEATEASPTIGSFKLGYTSASFSEPPSETITNNDDSDDSNLYGSAVVTQSFQDYADAYIYLFNDRGSGFTSVVNNEHSLQNTSIYDRTIDNIQHKFLINDNTESEEGITFGWVVKELGTTLNILIKPETENTTVNYRLGEEEGEEEQEGSFNSETLLTYTFPIYTYTPTEGGETVAYYSNHPVSFVRTNQTKFIIEKIYVN